MRRIVKELVESKWGYFAVLCTDNTMWILFSDGDYGYEWTQTPPIPDDGKEPPPPLAPSEPFTKG